MLPTLADVICTQFLGGHNWPKNPLIRRRTMSLRQDSAIAYFIESTLLYVAPADQLCALIPLATRLP